MAGHFGTKQNRTPVCKVCGKEPKYRAGYCREHYFAALKERRAKKHAKPRPCKHCHTLIENPGPFKQFCSYRCILDARNLRERKHKVLPAAAICKFCGALFAPNKAWQRFCSGKCSYRAKSARIYTKGRKPEQRIQGNCQSCGAPFDRPKRSYTRRTPKFCSIECAYRARRGADSPKFRGGLITYRGAKWLHIAEEIRARDEFLCGACHAFQKPRRKHPVDHVIPFRLMKQWGLDPNQYDNLLTVCDGCHGKKQSVEDKLLRGDLIGFVVGLLALQYPVGRIRLALAAAELSSSFLDYRVKKVG